jgi:hypothetical protein
MTDISPTNTLTRLTVAAGIAGVAALFTIVPAGAVPAEDFNPSCADLAPEGEIWTEFKIDANPDDGSHDAGGGITVTVEHLDAATVAWTSTVPVAAFINKGGPAATVEIYTPPVTADSATSPINPNNGEPYGISHVTWCFPEIEEPPADDPPADDPPAEEPPAEEPPVEEPPVEEPPAEEPPAEEPPAVSSVTTVPEVEVAGVQQAPPAALPRTGVASGPLLFAAALLAGMGSAAIRWSRRMVQ